jgi:hypothetical protein
VFFGGGSGSWCRGTLDDGLNVSQRALKRHTVMVPMIAAIALVGFGSAADHGQRPPGFTLGKKVFELPKRETFGGLSLVGSSSRPDPYLVENRNGFWRVCAIAGDKLEEVMPRQQGSVVPLGSDTNGFPVLRSQRDFHVQPDLNARVPLPPIHESLRLGVLLRKFVSRVVISQPYNARSEPFIMKGMEDWHASLNYRVAGWDVVPDRSYAVFIGFPATPRPIENPLSLLLGDFGGGDERSQVVKVQLPPWESKGQTFAEPRDLSINGYAVKAAPVAFALVNERFGLLLYEGHNFPPFNPNPPKKKDYVVTRLDLGTGELHSLARIERPEGIGDSDLVLASGGKTGALVLSGRQVWRFRTD